MKRILLALALLAPALSRADTLTIRRIDALNLYGALNSLKDGLSPENTGLAADDLTALKPVVESWQKSKQSADRAFRDASTDKQKDVAQDSLDDYGQKTVDLTVYPFTITRDEITAAKIAPGILQPIKQFLSPKASK